MYCPIDITRKKKQNTDVSKYINGNWKCACMNAINLFNSHPSGYIWFTKCCSMRASSKSKWIAMVDNHINVQNYVYAQIL